VVLKKIIALRQILPYLLVLVVGFFLFKSTISSTSLYGDEWKTLWLGEAAIHNTGSIFQQPSMEFSYIFATIIFHLIYKIAGFNSTYYYAFSFLTRLIAAIFFLLFLKNRGLSKISSFLGSMIFMISPVGIETTDWAKNFDSYLGVALLLILIPLSSRLKSLKSILIFLSLFTIAILVNTIRSPGIFIILGSTMIAQLISQRSKRTRRTYLYILIASGIIFALLATTKLFGGQPSQVLENFSFLPFTKSLLGSIGVVFVPSRHILLNFLVVSFFLILWKRRVFAKAKFRNLSFSHLYLLAVLLVSYQILRKGASFYVFGLMGIFFASILIFSIYREFKEKAYKSLQSTITIFFLSFSPMLIPLIRIPQIHPLTEHRYLIISALVIPFIIAYTLDGFLKGRINYNPTIWGLVLTLTTIFIVSLWIQSSHYLKLQASYHGTNYTNKVWSEITNSLQELDLNKTKVGIILLTKPQYEAQVFNSVYFGFGFHAGLIYNIWNENMLPPSWLITSGAIDKSKIPSHVITPDRKILVFEINGDKVTEKDIKF